jgi:hypothetical protein
MYLDKFYFYFYSILRHCPLAKEIRNPKNKKGVALPFQMLLLQQLYVKI